MEFCQTKNVCNFTMHLIWRKIGILMGLIKTLRSENFYASIKKYVMQGKALVWKEHTIDIELDHRPVKFEKSTFWK